jgi:hypothetical protein
MRAARREMRLRIQTAGIEYWLAVEVVEGDLFSLYGA